MAPFHDEEAPRPDVDVRAMQMQLRRMESAIGETRDLVAGNGREPGLAEMVRSISKSLGSLSRRLEEQDRRLGEQEALLLEHAAELEALRQAPDLRLASAVKALWVPVAAAGLIALAGLALLGFSLQLAAEANAPPALQRHP